VSVPHPIPYQGSKRWIAGTIVSCLPEDTATLIEPFAGSAAVSILAACRNKAARIHLNDINKPLMDLWRRIISEPESLADDYERLWFEQLGKERSYYDKVRKEFNKTKRPELLLYLLARCVKAAVRYNAKGEFNNSPDKRRKGARPENMRKRILGASNILRGKTSISSDDYLESIRFVKRQDLVYMDPPYQGVCRNRDSRYLKGVPYTQLVRSLEMLNTTGTSFILSYDGRTGDKEHGRTPPQSLELTHIEVDAGPSSQGTLLGRNVRTVESLYLSPSLVSRLGTVPEVLRASRGHQLEMGFLGHE